MVVEGSTKSARVWLACIARVHSHHRQPSHVEYDDHQCMFDVSSCGGIGGRSTSRIQFSVVLAIVGSYPKALETCSRLGIFGLVPQKVEPCGACCLWLLFGQHEKKKKGIDVA